MANVAMCSERSVTNIRKNMRLFGSPRSPLVPAGRPPNITPVMLDALRDHLAERPGLFVARWLSFYGMSLVYYYHYLASNLLFPELGGRKRKYSRKQKNRTLNYEISTSINYPSFVYIS